MCRSVDALSYAIDQCSQGRASPEIDGIGDKASAAIVADHMHQILRQHDVLRASGVVVVPATEFNVCCKPVCR